MPGIPSLATFLIASAVYTPHSFAPAMQPGVPDVFSPSGVALQLGLTPEALAGAGLSAEQAETLLGALSSAPQDRTGLRTLMEAIDRASTPQARAVARAAFTAARSELREGLMENHSPGCDGLAAAIAAGTARGLPADLAAVVCSAGGDAVATAADRVKRMLIAERRAIRMGRTLDRPVATELATLRAHPTAVLVRERLASTLAEIQGEFDGAWTSEQAPPP